MCVRVCICAASILNVGTTNDEYFSEPKMITRIETAKITSNIVIDIQQ